MIKIPSLELTTSEAAKITKSSNNLLNLWVARKFITPLRTEKTGRRKRKHFFSFYNLVEISIFLFLGHDLLMEYETISNILYDPNADLTKSIEDGKTLLINIPTVWAQKDKKNTNITIPDSEREIFSTINESCVTITLNLKKIRDSLIPRIKDIIDSEGKE